MTRGRYKKVDVQDRDSLFDETEITHRKTINQNFIIHSILIILLILIYFAHSVGLTFYQRWLLQRFHFPLSVVIFHLVVKFLLSTALREIWTCIKGQRRITLTWRQYVKAVAATGVASGIDVGFSNWGLELVTMSLYTMTKSTTIIFILACAIVFKLEKKSWALCAIVIMISGGLFLFTYKSTQFDALGFTMLLLASFASGIRWTCAQMLMQKAKNGLSNPVDMMYHIQPWMMVTLLPFAICFEGMSIVSSCKAFRYSDWHLMAATFLKILVGALIAFGMEISEFLVVTSTSSLTLSIAGIFKEVFILILAVKLNGDKFSSPINFIGLLLCLFGIISHIIHKVMTAGSVEQSVVHRELEATHFSYSHEIRKPLMEETPTPSIVSSDEEDSQVIFNVLNSRDR